MGVCTGTEMWDSCYCLHCKLLCLRAAGGPSQTDTGNTSISKPPSAAKIVRRLSFVGDSGAQSGVQGQHHDIDAFTTLSHLTGLLAN